MANSVLTPIQERALNEAAKNDYLLYYDPIKGDKFMTAYLYKPKENVRLTIRQSTLKSFVSKQLVRKLKDAPVDPEHPDAEAYQLTPKAKQALQGEAIIPVSDSKPAGYITLREGLEYLRSKGSGIKLITLQHAAKEYRLQTVIVHEARGDVYYTTPECLDAFAETLRAED